MGYRDVLRGVPRSVRRWGAAALVASHTESQVPTTTCGGEDDAIVSLTEQIVSENSTMLNAVIGYSDQAYPYGVTQGTEPGARGGDLIASSLHTGSA